MDAKQRLAEIFRRLETNASSIEAKVKEIDKTTKFSRQTMYNIENEITKSISTKTANALILAYPQLSFVWLTTGKGEMFNTPDFTKDLKINESSVINLPDPLEQLANVKKIKANGKQTNANEGHIVEDDELVPVKTYIIPIKGFAGLKKHFFADEYISEQFEETVTYVHKSKRVPRLLKIQADGNSMPPLISPGDFVTCEPINELTFDYKFRPDKIYCFFHHLRGILFKRAENKPHNQVELSSDNPDKIEYPNEIFDIGEFKKILIVTEIVKIV